MQRVNNPPNNLYEDGNSGNGTRGTRVQAAYLNSIQEEICSVIESEGIIINPSAYNQLLNAIIAKINAHADLTDNPHGVTKAQVGLSNVANVAQGRFVNAADGGPYISSVRFHVDDNIPQATWESIGPTGSAAANIWTALDLVPAGVNWVDIMVRSFFQTASGGDGYDSANMWVRRTGGAMLATGTNEVIGYRETKASGAAISGGNDVLRVPVDASRRFDMRWTSNFSFANDIYLVLQGYGWNG